MKNYLLTVPVNSNVDYTKLDIHDFVPAIKELTTRLFYNTGVTLQKETILFNDLVVSEDASRLAFINSILHNLLNTCSTTELENIADECDTICTEYYNNSRIAYSEREYNAYKNIKNNESYFSSLKYYEQKYVIDAIEYYEEESDINFSHDTKIYLSSLYSKLNKAQQNFSNNIIKHTAKNRYYFEHDFQVEGIPDNIKDIMRENARADGHESGYVATTEHYIYTAIMQYCSYEYTRKTMLEAFYVASNGEYSNTTNITDIVSIKSEIAKLFGFSTFAEKSLKHKMAKTPNNVFSVLNKLKDLVVDKALEEEKELLTFAKSKGYQRPSVRAADRNYYSTMRLKEEYNLDKKVIEEYYTYAGVLPCIYGVIKKLFDVTFVEDPDASVWHEDVKCYKVFEDSKHIAYIFIDPFSRNGKQSGAWMNGIIKRDFAYNTTLPVAVIVTNLSKTSITLDDVRTLLHEFGHALHHVLTKIEFPNYNGISVEWDAVELPSQLLENWINDKELLIEMSSHYSTKEKIPEYIIDNWLAIDNYMAASSLRTQLLYSLVDMKIFNSNAKTDKDCIEIFNEVAKDLKLNTEDNPFMHLFLYSFSHIFSGGYTAGYYSYLWAEIMSSDVYLEFKNKGMYNIEFANKIKKDILYAGSINDFDVMYRTLMGRDPDPESLLIVRGLQNSKK
ncbi:hypothetical protein Paride_0500 [Pseudomonas phage Paride]|nr:hypothetical protein Paride_0500 [Pseudomonas phage Paride]